jgi:hypothetical protein
VFTAGNEVLNYDVSTCLQYLPPPVKGFCGTHLSVSGEVDLKCLAVILETKRRHGKKDIFAVDGLALLLLAFLRG